MISRSFSLKEDVVDDYDAYSEDFFEGRLFFGGYRSWDKGGKSRVKLLQFILGVLCIIEVCGLSFK